MSIDWLFQIITSRGLITSLSLTTDTRKCGYLWTLLLSEEIKSVNLKGNQPWILVGRTDAEAEAPILWPRDVNSWLTGKRPRLGKIEGRRKREQKGWDGRMASPMQWTWTWANAGRCRGTGNHGRLQCMGLKRVGHDWATEQQPNQGSNPRPRQSKHSLTPGQPGNSQYFSI